jgi:hypothetical protein
MALTFNRTQFLAITGLTDDGLKSLARRNQLPFSLEENDRGAYKFLDAYLTIAFMHLTDAMHVSVTRAAEIGRNCAGPVIQEWKRITDYAFDDSHVELQMGCMALQGRSPWYFCNTLGERAEISRGLPPETSTISVSASLSAKVMAASASRALGIMFASEFWPAEL